MCGRLGESQPWRRVLVTARVCTSATLTRVATVTVIGVAVSGGVAPIGWRFIARRQGDGRLVNRLGDAVPPIDELGGHRCVVFQRQLSAVDAAAVANSGVASRWLDVLLGWLDVHAPSVALFEQLDVPAMIEVDATRALLSLVRLTRSSARARSCASARATRCKNDW